MAGMTASRPIGKLRGKSKAKWARKSKERGNTPIGQHGRSGNQQAHRHGKKRNNRGRSPAGCMGRDFCQHIVQAHKGIKGNDEA